MKPDTPEWVTALAEQLGVDVLVGPNASTAGLADMLDRIASWSITEHDTLAERYLSVGMACHYAAARLRQLDEVKEALITQTPAKLDK